MGLRGKLAGTGTVHGVTGNDKKWSETRMNSTSGFASHSPDVNFRHVVLLPSGLMSSRIHEPERSVASLENGIKGFLQHGMGCSSETEIRARLVEIN